MYIKALLVAALITSASAYDKEDIIRDYEQKEYKKVCLQSAEFYKNDGKDEELLTITGDACARSDYINPLGYIVKNLISTPAYRQNASYFATILLHKKLLYQFMNDRIDLSNIKLPRTEHILSETFEHLATQNYEKQGDVFVIERGQNQKIHIYTKAREGNIWFVIEEYEDGKLMQEHWYI